MRDTRRLYPVHVPHQRFANAWLEFSGSVDVPVGAVAVALTWL